MIIFLLVKMHNGKILPRSKICTKDSLHHANVSPIILYKDFWFGAQKTKYSIKALLGNVEYIMKHCPIVDMARVV